MDWQSGQEIPSAEIGNHNEVYDLAQLGDEHLRENSEEAREHWPMNWTVCNFIFQSILEYFMQNMKSNPY